MPALYHGRARATGFGWAKPHHLGQQCTQTRFASTWYCCKPLRNQHVNRYTLGKKTSQLPPNLQFPFTSQGECAAHKIFPIDGVEGAAMTCTLLESDKHRPLRDRGTAHARGRTEPNGTRTHPRTRGQHVRCRSTRIWGSKTCWTATRDVRTQCLVQSRKARTRPATVRGKLVALST